MLKSPGDLDPDKEIAGLFTKLGLDEAVVLACRAALRSLPFLVELNEKLGDASIQVFRACAISLTAGACIRTAKLTGAGTLSDFATEGARRYAVAGSPCYGTVSAAAAVARAAAGLNGSYSHAAAMRAAAVAAMRAVDNDRELKFEILNDAAGYVNPEFAPYHLASCGLWSGEPPVELARNWSELKYLLSDEQGGFWKTWID